MYRTLIRMDSPAVLTPPRSSQLHLIPKWAVSRDASTRAADAAFAAGSALAALDNLVRSEPPWAGCWRARQALSCAAATVKWMGRTEDEAAVRDAVLLSAPGDDSGPAGRVFLAFKMLAQRSAPITTPRLREVADLLSLKWDAALADMPGLVDEALQSGRAAPFVCAEVARSVCVARPDAEALAWGLADAALAQLLGWSQPVPMLIAERSGAAFRHAEGRGRLRPADDGFDRAVCLALVQGTRAALHRASEIGRHADQLLAVAPKLRTKGADKVTQQLLTNDAVSVARTDGDLSRWASRRLFERLKAFGAVRELSGRSSFKIYGL